MIKNTKIIFLDLDGTLLNNSNEVTEYTKKIIKKVKEKGIYVVLCSGRANSDIITKSKEANASPIIISNNGSMIFDYESNIKIYESKIDHQFLEELWDFEKKHNINITYNSTHKRYKSKNSTKDATIIYDMSEITDNVSQIVIDSKNYKDIKELEKLIKEKYNKLKIKNFWKQNIGKSNNYYFEMDITNKFNSKGRAINKVLKTLNINKNNAICFGDQINDEPMFKMCGTKIAMKNGNKKLQKEADFITEYTNSEDGVAKFIDKYILCQ